MDDSFLNAFKWADFDPSMMKGQRESEDRNLVADDSEYQGRFIPGDLKDRAVNEVVEEETVFDTRKRKQRRTFGAELPMAKRLKRKLVARNIEMPCMESCQGKRRE
jgi:hypothetical protein